MDLDYDQRALKQGIQACDDALDQLNHIHKDLQKTAKWEIVRALPLKPVSLAIKKEKISLTNRAARDAENVLYELAKLIDDISAYRSFKQDLALPDKVVRNLFDGFLEDVYLQTSIRKTLRRVELAIKEVEARKKKMAFLLHKEEARPRSVLYKLTPQAIAGKAVRSLKIMKRKASFMKKDDKKPH